MSSKYVGRFAPTPSGPLHFGSIVAALGSYCDAKHHGGQWLLRFDDLDKQRTNAGHASHILRTLEKYGLHWDMEPVYQTQRTQLYREWIEKLQESGASYPCGCTRKEIKERAREIVNGHRYDNFCRDKSPTKQPRSYRVRLPTPCVTTINDSAKGKISEDLAETSGDFIIYYSKDLPAYHLASVVDDQEMNITHVVRGNDLLRSSIRQAHLQEILSLNTTKYLHLPLAMSESGRKLSKQNHAEPVKTVNAGETLIRALHLMGQDVTNIKDVMKVEEIVASAIKNWSRNPMGCSTLGAIDRTTTHSNQNQDQ